MSVVLMSTRGALPEGYLGMTPPQKNAYRPQFFFKVFQWSARIMNADDKHYNEAEHLHRH